MKYFKFLLFSFTLFFLTTCAEDDPIVTKGSVYGRITENLSNESIIAAQVSISGKSVSILQLIFMRIRKVPPSLIVNALINGNKAGIPVTANDLETHYMAGGNVNNVVKALISADKANIPLGFNMAAAIDLAGRDVADAVQLSVNPRVINTPPVAAVAKDGIQLIAKAKVTVRANIAQLVGGAGEDTILARVGEGIVTTMGSA